MPVREEVIKNMLNTLQAYFDDQELQIIENTFYIHFKNYMVTRRENDNTQLTTDISPDVKAYQMFFISKKIEGLSQKSLRYYKCTIDRFFRIIQKPFSQITTNDIRLFIATQKASPVTVNGYRRCLSSFFNWLTAEEYIPKNPMLRITKIKEPKTVMKAFTAAEIEILRDAARNIRERAIIDILISTGMRCGELHGLNIDDVDFTKNEIIVTGKGNKQRICYLNAPAVKHLKDYLATRNDNYKALFTADLDNTKRVKDNRLGIAGIEIMVRELGRIAGINKTHPHKFRITAATLALQRGMPIEQVRIMLGHENINTTMRYAITADDTVKHSHSKFM